MIKLQRDDLLKCCGSRRWAEAMAEHSFPNAKETIATADSIWWSLAPEDWYEAFRAQRPIESRDDLPGTKPDTQRMIHMAAELYRERFGMPFVTAVSGKTAMQVLRSLQERAAGEPAAELRANAAQMLNIAHTRLKRLLPR